MNDQEMFEAAVEDTIQTAAYISINQIKSYLERTGWEQSWQNEHNPEGNVMYVWHPKPNSLWGTDAAYVILGPNDDAKQISNIIEWIAEQVEFRKPSEVLNDIAKESNET